MYSLGEMYGMAAVSRSISCMRGIEASRAHTRMVRITARRRRLSSGIAQRSGAQPHAANQQDGQGELPGGQRTLPGPNGVKNARATQAASVLRTSERAGAGRAALGDDRTAHCVGWSERGCCRYAADAHPLSLSAPQMFRSCRRKTKTRPGRRGGQAQWQNAPSGRRLRTDREPLGRTRDPIRFSVHYRRSAGSYNGPRMHAGVRPYGSTQNVRPQQ
jgi:hypothetical protein